MNIQLSNALEASLRALVISGHFASEDHAVAEIVREYFQRNQQLSQAIEVNSIPDPLMGIWQDYAEEMDQIVADAMKLRKEESCRVDASQDTAQPDHDPILGLFRDDAELMDEIVADAYRQRNVGSIGAMRNAADESDAAAGSPVI